MLIELDFSGPNLGNDYSAVLVFEKNFKKLITQILKYQ